MIVQPDRRTDRQAESAFVPAVDPADQARAAAVIADPRKRWGSGVIIGKFLPPHAGHHFLISTAARCVDHLTVWVGDRDGDPWPAVDRVRWLREAHTETNVTFEVIADIGFDDDSGVWAAYTRGLFGCAPDVVFTSESYGSTWAAELGCDHVCVDPGRDTFAVSGTGVRGDVAANWMMLSAPVRAALVQRVVVVGAESTGTTTLTADLAEAFGALWVPEFGREYCEARMTDDAEIAWDTAAFIEIAATQAAREDTAARLSGPVLFCDTDALATAIWHERYMGRWDAGLARIGRRPYALRLLTMNDIAFVQDGTRDGEHIRQWMTDRFVQVLAADVVPFVSVAGSRQHRLAAAVSAVSARTGISPIGK